MSKHVSFPKNKIKVFLLEKIHEAAQETLESAGFNVTVIPKAVEKAELDSILAEAFIIGVRSRTKLRKEHFPAAKRLLAVGCFSVGTDQVSIDDATTAGVPVFNAPYSSTRSVAELTIGDVIMLARRVGDKNSKMHLGTWDKNLSGAQEVRNKTIGIIGYGHIGQQVGILAEALGMEVMFYDLLKKLPLGRAKPMVSMEALLKGADFVTLHVPGTTQTRNLIAERELKEMRRGAYLLNLSRGQVVDLGALKGALSSKHLAGAALDVFPEEPTPAEAPFASDLSELENVILTPHVGGNTEEAQRNIGIEVASALESYIDTGSTEGAVNFPSINMTPFPNSHRILNIHRNIPGALSEINRIVSEVGANIDAQQLGTYKDIGYLVMDVNREVSEEARSRIAELPLSVKTRILY